MLRHLGTGGMGTVVLARDERLHREVAVKRVHASGGADATRRMRREAKLGAGLTHRALVTIFDTLVEDGELIIVMEYVAGETLAARLGRGRLAPAEALAVLRPVAEALDHAHAHGIVHRDVKPANVLLGERGTVKLADLGVAIGDDHSRITHDGAMVGSLSYMAPEQFGPVRATGAADVHALAAVAFEALSGCRARAGSTPLALARSATKDPAPDLLAAAPELPAAAGAVLAAGMAREPGNRPGSATILVRELEVALAPMVATAAPAASPALAPVAPPTPTPTPVAAPPPTPTPVAAPTPAPRSPAARSGPRPAAPRPAPLARPGSRPAAPRPAGLAPSAPRPVRPPGGGRGRRAPAAAGVLALLAAGTLFVVLSGGDDPASQRSADRAARPSPTAAPDETPPGTAAPASDDPSTPTGAVRAFYERAARDDFGGAWALAGPGMRAVFDGSQARLAEDLGSLRSIRFKTLTAEGAASGGTRVRVETVARHTDRTDRCTGALLAVPDGSGAFRVDPAGLSCTSS